MRDRLSQKFGNTNVFMDVDNLLPGQRFDRELDHALSQCDVLIAVIGPRWMKLLSGHARTRERDFVHEEIAAALKRDIVVIPAIIGRKGNMPSLPRRDDLPEDIRDLVLHQRQDIAHESFGRDVDELIEAVKFVLRGGRRAAPWRAIAISGAAALVLAVGLLGYWMQIILPPKPGPNIPQSGGGAGGATFHAQSNLDAARAAADESARKRAADEAAARTKSDEQTKLDAGADCDRLAASPFDANRSKAVAGIDLAKIDAAAATTACDNAMRLNPETARFIFQAARAADARKDYTRAAELYRAAIDKGFPLAMFNVGTMYLKGQGVARDYAEARKWYEKGAALDEPASLNGLGFLYDNSLGVRPSYAEALKWFEKAAGLGSTVAMSNLGLLYENGRGVAKDREQARKWYQKAADAGDEDAKERLKNLK